MRHESSAYLGWFLSSGAFAMTRTPGGARCSIASGRAAYEGY